MELQANMYNGVKEMEQRNKMARNVKKKKKKKANFKVPFSKKTHPLEYT